MSKKITIRQALNQDSPILLQFIRQLAEYEKLSHEVVATEELLEQSLFGNKPSAEVLIAELDNQAVGFALFFHNYSTFLGRAGIYLEDLFVIPRVRGIGVGKKLLSHVAKLAVERNCGRLEWSVLDWNSDAIGFYESIGAISMDGWTVNRLTGQALMQLAE